VVWHKGQHIPREIVTAVRKISMPADTTRNLREVMNFIQIQSFYLVAKLGTYQAAAERLHATQPAISARIASLENVLKIRLFDRSGYRVSLTPAGERFLPFAEQMLELQTEALIQISSGHDLNGIVRIGTSDTMVSSWLPDFLIAFERSHPGISIEVYSKSSPHLAQDLLNHSIDLAFLVGSISSNTVISKEFCECDMGFLAAPSLGLHSLDLSVSDLRRQNFLTFEKITIPYQDLKRTIKGLGISAKLNPISSLHSILILTRKGLGIGYLPLIAAEADIKSGNLVALHLPLKSSSISFTINYLDGPRRPLIETIANSAMAFVKDHWRSEYMQIRF
jgi:DNA-binding transcriptional LysR family regulator